MKWILPLGALAFIVFLAVLGTNATRERQACEAKDGVFVSRDYLCLKKECVIDVSH
jgi:hypothetical protein